MFGAWALGIVVMVTYLMALHAIPLPPAKVTTRAPATSHVPAHAWQEIHVLAADCPCSQSVADQLLERGPAMQWRELIYVAGEKTNDSTDMAARLSAKGFEVQCVTPDELQSQWQVRGGPWLLWLDPDDRLRYSGGYAAQRPRPGVAVEDQAILRRLQTGATITPYPAFGCAIDPALKKKLNPLALQ